MSDLVRLEYRNVSMRFAAASGKALAAVERVSFAVRTFLAMSESVPRMIRSSGQLTR